MPDNPEQWVIERPAAAGPYPFRLMSMEINQCFWGLAAPNVYLTAWRFFPTRDAAVAYVVEKLVIGEPGFDDVTVKNYAEEAQEQLIAAALTEDDDDLGP